MSQAAAPTPQKSSTDWLAVLQFASSGLVVGSGLSSVVGIALVSLLMPAGEAADSLLTLSNLLAVLAATLLLMPSAVHAARRILGKPGVPFRAYGRGFGYSILAVPACLAAAQLATQAGLDWLVALLYLVPAILLIAWLVWLAIRQIPGLSAQRVWGSLSAGMLGVTSLSLVPEILAGVFIFIGIALYVQITPQLGQALEALLQGAESMQDLSLLAPFMNDPVILLAVFFSLAVVAPVVEELFKPLAVALLLRRRLNAAEGLALGALSGAGFALVENLFVSAPAEALAVAIAGRTGASAMHVLTGALGGLALVQAKQSGSYWRLAGIYALNVAVHAAWNGLVLLSSAGGVSLAAGGGLVPVLFAVVGPLLLVLFSLVFILSLWLLNRSLRTSTLPD